MHNKGFTLVEIAIVLTVISVILAVVVSATTLQKQAELRGVIVEFEKYKDSYEKFLTLYKMAPGDFNRADSIWSDDCADTITCNGDGNGAIDAYPGSSLSESAKAWKHLSRAGVLSYVINTIPSTYTGDLDFNIAPKSNYLNGGYFMAAGSNIGGDSGAIASPFVGISEITNAIFIGGIRPTTTFVNGVISSLDAQSIDQKIDDGLANAGYFRTITAENGGSNCLNGGAYTLDSAHTACISGYQLDNRR